MPRIAKKRTKPRSPLSRDRVLQAAMKLADREGIEALSMRRLGSALRVEAMSLYRHVASRDEVLDGMCDLILGEITIPPEDADWQEAMRLRAHSLHDAILRHPWAASLIESRTSLSPSRLRYADALVGSLRRGGFSIASTYLAIIILDSYIYGFCLQEVSWPVGAADSPEVTRQMQAGVSAQAYPDLSEIMSYVVASRKARNAAAGGSADYGAEFDFGLELILDGLERHRGTGRGRESSG